MNRRNYWKMPTQDIYSTFLDIISKLVEKNSTNKVQISKDRLFQHEMFIKYTFHLASIFTLEKGSYFSKSDARKIAYDYSSVIVLFRAALETYLTYYYIYCDSINEDEKMFRYCNWLIDGLNFRQTINVSFSSELQQKKEKENIEIIESIEIIWKTDAFNNLSEKQKQLVITKRQWIKPGWADIIAKTGMTEYWAKRFYSLFSAYAHTTSLSIMQFRDATIKGEGKQLSSSFASIIFMVSALFINSYEKHFNLDNVLDKVELEMLEAWIWMSKNMSQS
jgi:hypothetical protein